MRSALTVLFAILIASPLAAQGRGKRSQGIPPGHMPPPGACRVWYDGVPPGHQPPPTSCREAERVAAREPGARVIYGAYDNSRDRNDGRWRTDGDRGDRPRAVPRRDRSGGYGAYGYDRVAFDNGYKDGYDKGREDGRDNDRYDPSRHGRYRSGDHGYDKRAGTKDQYRSIYRQGFEAGYDDGYREMNGYGGNRRRGAFGLPWPF